MQKIEMTQIIKSKARRYNIDWRLVWAIGWQESNLNPDAKGDNGQSIGVMQIQLATASELMGRQVTPGELKIAELNIELGTRYLAWQLGRYDNNMRKAVGAYNAGSYKEKDGRPINENYINGVMAVFDAVSVLT